LQAHLTQSGLSSAVATLDGHSHFGAHFQGSQKVASVLQAFSGRAERGTLPAQSGRLTPQPGARVQPDFELRTVPSAGAVTGCDVVCAVLYATGCWACSGR